METEITRKALKLVNNHRLHIRQCNEENWLFEGRDRLNAMKEFPEMAESIFESLEERAGIHMQTDQSKLPPALWRRPDEPAVDYLNRCYDRAGYVDGPIWPVPAPSTPMPEKLKGVK